MPIAGVVQPDFIEISEDLRLRKYDGNHAFALSWYQDEETLMLVDGKNDPYTPERLTNMYEYLDEHGELYFIEIRKDGVFLPIGDVTFWQEDMPIVIGIPEYRGHGIGRKVVEALITRGRQLGYRELFINEIYEWNIGSQKMFEHAGFQKFSKKDEGYCYRIDLSK